MLLPLSFVHLTFSFHILILVWMFNLKKKNALSISLSGKRTSSMVANASLISMSAHFCRSIVDHTLGFSMGPGPAGVLRSPAIRPV